MLDRAEQTTHEMMSKYDHEVQKLSEQVNLSTVDNDRCRSLGFYLFQLCNVQHEYERLKTLHKQHQPIKGIQEILPELGRLRERNKVPFRCLKSSLMPRLDRCWRSIISV